MTTTNENARFATSDEMGGSDFDRDRRALNICNVSVRPSPFRTLWFAGRGTYATRVSLRPLGVEGRGTYAT